MVSRPLSSRRILPNHYRLRRNILCALGLGILTFVLLLDSGLGSVTQASYSLSDKHIATLSTRLVSQGGPTLSSSGTASGTRVTIQVEGADKPKPPLNAPPFRVVIWISGVPYTDQVFSPKYNEDNGQWEFDFDIPAGIKGQSVEIAAVSLIDNGPDASVGFKAS